MGAWYCTREDVKNALDSTESARNNGQIDRAVEAASRSIEGLTHRVFYPTVDTRYFDWPSDQMGRAWRLWLDEHELVSVSSLSSGGTAITAYNLEPNGSGPPYNRVEIQLSSSASFGGGSTPQQAITITGVFGYNTDSEPAGTVAEALDSSETGVDVSDSSVVGVGDLLLIDSERMIVTGKSMLTTGQTLQTPLTAVTSNVTVAVTTGTAYAVDEVILLDSERMLITDIAGNNLTVKRAYDGTVLATHTGSTIYAPRTLTVTRGAVGTTAASHSTSTAITKHVVPGPVRQLAIAEALTSLQQQSSGYGRTVGTGDAQREASGKGLGDIRRQVVASHGRRARIRVV